MGSWSEWTLFFQKMSLDVMKNLILFYFSKCQKIDFSKNAFICIKPIFIYFWIFFKQIEIKWMKFLYFAIVCQNWYGLQYEYNLIYWQVIQKVKCILKLQVQP